MDEKRLVDANNFYRFIDEQLVKETGAFSKGVNKGLNIARSALKNRQITPTIDPETLPIVKELREKLARYEQAEIESRVYKDTGASGPWVTIDGKMFWWNDPEHSDLSNKNPLEVTNEEFEKADSAAYERAIAHEKEFMERKNNELQ